MKITVVGRRYSEMAQFYRWDDHKDWPYFEIVKEKTWEIEGETLNDGRKWLAKNHPDMYMGGNIKCENGDFACMAVPCIEYGRGNFETIAARIACVKKEARERF